MFKLLLIKIEQGSRVSICRPIANNGFLKRHAHVFIAELLNETPVLFNLPDLSLIVELNFFVRLQFAYLNVPYRKFFEGLDLVFYFFGGL
jgi:hypothetical protein